MSYLKLLESMDLKVVNVFGVLEGQVGRKKEDARKKNMVQRLKKMLETMVFME